MPAKYLFITGKMHKAQVLYSVAFIEGKEHLYQVVAIVPKKREEQYRPIVENLFQSFREINSNSNESKN